MDNLKLPAAALMFGMLTGTAAAAVVLVIALVEPEHSFAELLVHLSQ